MEKKYVIKRNGDYQKFDKFKIEQAVNSQLP